MIVLPGADGRRFFQAGEWRRWLKSGALPITSKWNWTRIAHKNGGYYVKNMQTISLKLAALDKEAKVRRVTKSLLVRESLEKELRQQSAGPASCCDLARDLAGIVKGLPRDLADNPKYMEGFGE